MTNEQLAEFIQAGGAEDLMPVLYQRVKHLMYDIAGRYYAKYKKRFTACGVELPDLRAECYTAYLKALESFKPAQSYKFVSYLDLHIKNACNKLLGIRNGRKNNKPLDNCISLDEPARREDDSFTLGDTVEDDTAQQAFEDVIDRIQDEQTRQVLHNALSRLDDKLRDVIVLIYFEGLTQEAIGKRLGVSGECIRQRKAKALRKLRNMPEVRILREEQRIERKYHFDSRHNNNIAYYKAQKIIAEILKRGDYLSYGKRQAIIYDCQLRQALEDNKEYQTWSMFEQALSEQACEG